MINHDFYKAITAKTGIAMTDVQEILRAAASVIYETLDNNRDERISLSNLGFFKVKHVSEHSTTSNLGDMKGNVYTTPAHDEIVFVPFSNYKVLKEHTGD